MPIQIYNQQSGPLRVQGAGFHPQSGSLPGLGAAQMQAAHNTASMVRSVESMVQVAGREMQRRARVDAFAAYAELQRDQLSFEHAYFTERQGRDAVDAAKDFAAFTNERRQTIGARLAGAALQEFNMRASSVELDSFARGSRYGHQQDAVYREDVLKGMRASHEQLLAARPDDYTAIAQSRRNLEDALQTIMPGRDHTAVKAKWDQDDAAQMVNQALAARNTGKAEALLRELGPKLGDHAANLQLRVLSMRDTQERLAETAAARAEREALKNAALSGYAGMREALRDVPLEERGARAAAFIDAQPDVRVREAMLDFYTHDSRVDKLRQDGQDETLRRDFLQQTSGLAYSERLAALDQVTGLSAQARDRLEKELQGGASSTDLDAFEAVEKGIYAGRYESEADVRRSMDDLRITTADKDRLVSIHGAVSKSEDRGLAGAVTRMEKNLEALGVAKEQRAAVRMALHDTLQLEAKDNNGKLPSRERIDQITRQLAARGATGKLGFFGGMREDVMAVELAQIPLDAQREIRAALRANGFAGELAPSLIVQEWNRPDNEAYRDTFTPSTQPAAKTEPSAGYDAWSY